ncbi:MAG: PAS domain S-box protein [Pseudomonadota bacterium]|nr:PAS domain S-box protein [Pseudomonadota bacterium]
MNSSDLSGLTTVALDAACASALRASQEAVVIVDEQQRVVLFNPAAQRMFDCTEASALGSDLSRFIPERYRRAHAAHVRDFDGSGAIERPMRGRAPICGLRANGEEFPAQATISRVEVPGASGPRHYFTALVRDLTREHDLKAEIDSLTDKMQSIFDLAPIAIWITDGDSIVYANPVCTELFAAPDRTSLVGRSIYTLLQPDSHAPVRRKMAKVWSSNAPVSLVHEQIARLDGTSRHVDIAMATLPCPDRTVLQMVITDVSRRTQERLDLERSRRELQRLSANQVDAREAERRHIARELHDELGQRLTSLKMELSSIGRARRGKPDDRIGAMLEMVDDTVASVRRIASDLRPMMLDDLGLNPAIEWLARESARRIGIEITLDLVELAEPMNETMTIAVYRIVQEALTNVARHAKARRVSISTKRVGHELLLSVEDDGIGFPAESSGRDGSHGLIGIRERAHILGGRFTYGNTPSGGAQIVVALPLGAVEAGAAPATSELASLGARRRAKTGAPSNPSVHELTHELHVHQIELEMQNEELQRTQIELAAARDRYIDLYDFAPVGYFTLDRQGVVTEVNLTGASLLGKTRAALMGRPFARFIERSDSDLWHRHLNQALEHDGAQSIELTMRPASGAMFQAKIDSLRIARPDVEPTLRITLSDVTQRRQAEMDRRVAIATVNTSEAERRRVARELHEELGQRLSALKMDLSGLLRPNDRRADNGRIGEMLQVTDAALATVRRITSELRPLMLDDLGLNAAIDWLARESERRSGVEVRLSLDEVDPPLDANRTLALFRAVQSALSEVTRHTSEQSVHLMLNQRDDELVLVVQAPGSGWPHTSTDTEIDSTSSVREHAHMLGGQLSIENGPGNGRKITIRVPISPPAVPAGDAGGDSRSRMDT